MKIAVHMYFEERQHYCLAMLEFLNCISDGMLLKKHSIGDTAVRTDRGLRSRRTKCHNQKQLRRVTVQHALFSAGETKAEKCVCSPQAIPWPATKLTKQFHI